MRTNTALRVFVWVCITGPAYGLLASGESEVESAAFGHDQAGEVVEVPVPAAGLDGGFGPVVDGPEPGVGWSGPDGAQDVEAVAVDLLAEPGELPDAGRRGRRPRSCTCGPSCSRSRPRRWNAARRTGPDPVRRAGRRRPARISGPRSSNRRASDGSRRCAARARSTRRPAVRSHACTRSSSSPTAPSTRSRRDPRTPRAPARAPA